MIDKNILFLGFGVGENYFKHFSKFDKYPQVAARKFEMCYINGMLANNVNVIAVSVFPGSTYPLNKKIFFPFEFKCDEGYDNYVAGYINLIGLKILTKMISIFSIVFKFNLIFRDLKIVVYSSHLPLLMTAWILSKLFKKDFYVVLPDLPIYMFGSKSKLKIKEVLKKIDQWLVKKILFEASGLSCVTDLMTKKMGWEDQNRSIVIEGMYDYKYNFHLFNKPILNGKKYFLYSGALEVGYGIVEMVDFFIKSEVDAELWICGFGNLSSYVKELSRNNENIKYLGYLEQKELWGIQKNAAALLLTRDPNAEYVKYSFPSKILEYLATGVPIISTKLPCYPVEYDDYLIYVEYNDAVSYKNIFNYVLKMDIELKKYISQKNVAFVVDCKNPKMSVKKMIDLMFVK